MKQSIEIQQSTLYRQYIKLLGWEAPVVSGVQVFIKQFPFVGGLAKLQRPTILPPIDTFIALLAQHHVRRVAIEPTHTQNPAQLATWIQSLKKHYTLSTSPYLSTKTITVDLTGIEDTMFHRFTEAKRRAVRRAQTLGVMVKESQNIGELIAIKNKSAGLFGFITTFGIKQLWSVFNPKHATILLAYTSPKKIVGGILLLFWHDTAYYWIAGATAHGKKLFAPTLLVWEALKRSKHQGCTVFDFVGVWDERIPRENISWKGFTKFKEGFGGEIRYYPLVR